MATETPLLEIQSSFREADASVAAASVPRFKFTLLLKVEYSALFEEPFSDEKSEGAVL
ncbi:hypothetical protein [Desulfosporosinus hippei]|uniref:hypothetical protein n=1 Tax=Desulfosporosinus hippei TaxID=569859 RepID=UPI0015A1619A|nr:hypothetical protein [Desulfosporosinus hippei]